MYNRDRHSTSNFIEDFEHEQYIIYRLNLSRPWIFKKNILNYSDGVYEKQIHLLRPSISIYTETAVIITQRKKHVVDNTLILHSIREIKCSYSF
jgi:hypothetical protein